MKTTLKCFLIGFIVSAIGVYVYHNISVRRYTTEIQQCKTDLAKVEKAVEEQRRLGCWIKNTNNNQQ